MAQAPHHSARRIGVGSYTVATSRKFFARLDRQAPSKRRTVATHLTVRLGDLDQFRAVAHALCLSPAVHRP